jgi:hypothetical protein
LADSLCDLRGESLWLKASMIGEGRSCSVPFELYPGIFLREVSRVVGNYSLRRLGRLFRGNLGWPAEHQSTSARALLYEKKRFEKALQFSTAGVSGTVPGDSGSSEFTRECLRTENGVLKYLPSPGWHVTQPAGQLKSRRATVLTPALCVLEHILKKKLFTTRHHMCASCHITITTRSQLLTFHFLKTQLPKFIIGEEKHKTLHGMRCCSHLTRSHGRHVGTNENS